MVLEKIKVFTSYSGDVEINTDPETGEINAERKSLSLFWKEVVLDSDGSMYETGLRGAESLVLAEYPDIHASLEVVVGPAITAALTQIESKLSDQQANDP
jgi:hypothetical protein